MTEVAHLHPWHSQLEALDQTQVTFNREIVYVDVTLAEAEMWNKSFSYMCRKNINRSRQEQVRVFTAQTLDHVREFYRIYVQTMDRRSARSNYYFPFEYFAAFFEQVPEHARFVLAEYKDQIVASTLYLHDDQDVYSYLGGADHAFQLARPTNAVIHETIGWARAQGKRRLILGGGYKPDDGIFRFKASFSPLRATFNLYKRIHAYDQYNSLASAWAQFYHQDLDKDSYFPLYRIVPESN
ncbi:MAG: GNAT family N-acetyltransferase [Chloroflexi bacterium]|nr:GNAT family N-acetyltransferase [Chloroflexota bacterium]